MTLNDLENETPVNSLKTMETQSDMTYWDMSRRSYEDIDELTRGTFTKPENITSDNSPLIYVETAPEMGCR